MPNNLAPALNMAAKGYHIFPCEEDSKKPLVKWGEKATNDIQMVMYWWRTRPGANIAIATKPSNLVVVDTDIPSDLFVWPEPWDKVPGLQSGDDVLAFLAERKSPGDLAWLDTYTVRTGSGGMHRYYAAPPYEITNSGSRIGPKIDVRAAGGEFGGYVLAAGSVKNGQTYEVVINRPIAPLPPWLAALAVAPPPRPRPDVPKRQRGDGNDGTPDGVCARLTAWMEGTPPGLQSDRLYWAACEARDMGLTEAQTVEVFWPVIDRWPTSKGPWTLRDVEQQVASSYRRGKR